MERNDYGGPVEHYELLSAIYKRGVVSKVTVEGRSTLIKEGENTRIS